MKAQDTVIDPVESLQKAESKSEIEPTGMLAGHLLVKSFIS
jgi:hypothetical protein